MEAVRLSRMRAWVELALTENAFVEGCFRPDGSLATVAVHQDETPDVAVLGMIEGLAQTTYRSEL